MRSAIQVLAAIAATASLIVVSSATAQDWPQWRGPNRDGKVTGVKTPATWPAALVKKWDKPVGEGDAAPSLVGDRLYVFSREDGNEVMRALNAQTGEQIWEKKYPSAPLLSGDRDHAGPRAQPTVADGKVVGHGCDGMLTCWNAADGNQLWQKNEFVGKSPQFHAASSPIIVDGLCITQLGGARNSVGAMVAYELSTGNEKWRTNEGSGAYGSPVLMTIGGTKVIIGPSEATLVAVRASDGKLLWQLPYRQGVVNYNAASPIVDGQTLIIAGPGTGITALSLAIDGDSLKETELSTSKYTANSLGFNTPVLKDGALYGLSSSDQLFCVVNVTSPEPTSGWAAPIARPAGVGLRVPAVGHMIFAQQQEGERRGGQGGPGGGQPGRGPRRGGGGGGRLGYGTILDAGSVMFALSPAADLVIFKPSKDTFSEVARYKVSDEPGTFASPVLSGNRIFIKDKDSVALWTVE